MSKNGAIKLVAGNSNPALAQHIAEHLHTTLTKAGPRTPISAKLVANLITRAGADRVMTLDLHAGQIQGFFDIPTDNLYASPLMVRDIREKLQLDNIMVVSPDVGGVTRARGLAK